MTIYEQGSHSSLRTSQIRLDPFKSTTAKMSTSGAHAKSTFDPWKYPLFPDGLPTVKLETFSFAKLEQGDEKLQERLFLACKERGFFYLDLNGSDMSSMQRDCDDIVRLAEEVFQLPEEEKEKFPMKKKSLFG